MGRDERARTAPPPADPAEAAILEALAKSRRQLMDRFGRPIAEGNSYTYITPQPHVFTALEIAPTPRPDMPPNAYRVRLVATVDIFVLGGQPTEELCLVAVAPPPQRKQPDSAAEPPPAGQPVAETPAAEEPNHGQNERS